MVITPAHVAVATHWAAAAKNVMWIIRFVVRINFMKYLLIICVTLILLAFIGGQNQKTGDITVQTPMERCAQAMAALSQSDANRECTPLKSEEIYMAKKMAHEINPKANIELKEVSPASEQIKQTSESETAMAESAIQEKKQLDYGPALGRTFAEVTDGFEEYGINFDSSPLSNGEPRMIGKVNQSKAVVSVELIGLADNINRATLIIGAIKDGPLILGNIACMAIFMRNTMPDWQGGMNWLNSSIKKVINAKTSDKAIREIVHGDKRATLSFVKELGLFFLTIEHKDRRHPA